MEAESAASLSERKQGSHDDPRKQTSLLKELD
jgi:hypothetical protein